MNTGHHLHRTVVLAAADGSTAAIAIHGARLA